MVLEFYYHHQSPPSQALWMVLKELEIPYKANVVDLWTGEQLKEAFTAINKYQDVPAIVDGNLTISQSHAIAIYLCNKYETKDKEKKLYPTDMKEIAKFNRIMFRNIDNFQTLLKYMNEEEIFTQKASGPKEDLLPKATGVLQEIEDLLVGNPYVFGKHLTLLDFFILGSVSCMDIVDMDWKKFPNIAKWKSNMEKLPYHEECIAKGLEISKKTYKEWCGKVKSKTKF